MADGRLPAQCQRGAGGDSGLLAPQARQVRAGFADSAHGPAIYSNLSTADRVCLDDYARGVNLFIAQHPDSLPAEFRLLFYRPRPWSGVDSVSIGLVMVQMLDTHWEVKLGRERITAKLNDSKLEGDLYPVGSWRDHPPTGLVVDWSQPRPMPPALTSDLRKILALPLFTAMYIPK